MKTSTLYKFIVLLICSTLQAQVDIQNGNLDAIMLNQGASKVFRNAKNQGKQIQGSPYLQKMFGLAKVDNVAQKYYMRYNVNADEFEFITPKNDTLILDKITDFSKITFVGTGKKYELLDYTNDGGKYMKGYLIELHNKGNYTLYLKENISFYDGKIAKTSLEKDMPARFVKTDNTYYFKKSDKGIVEFPSSKKQLIKLFPEHKAVIESFLKENKVGFDEDYDRIKIIDFLSTL